MKKSEKEPVESLGDVKSICGDMKFLEEEVLRVFYLSSGNQLLEKKEFSGGVSSVAAEPRKIFKTALNSNAAAMILVHNHPSREADATREDVEVTQDFIELGEKMGVEVLDHVVAGEDFYSMRSGSRVEF